MIEDLIQQMNIELNASAEKHDSWGFYMTVLRYRDLGVTQQVVYDEVHRYFINYQEIPDTDVFVEFLADVLDAIVGWPPGRSHHIYSPNFNLPEWAKDYKDFRPYSF